MEEKYKKINSPKFFEKFRRLNKKGFTLLEVLIATFVLIVGVMGSVDLILSAFYGVLANEDKLTASYLAAEGLEIVRNIRDNNFRNKDNLSPPPAWDSGISDDLSINEEKTALVDWLGNTLLSFSSTPLLISNTYGFNYVEGANSAFYRTIKITKMSNDQILVKSIVNWTNHGRNFQVDAEEYLYNWY